MRAAAAGQLPVLKFAAGTCAVAATRPAAPSAIGSVHVSKQFRTGGHQRLTCPSSSIAWQSLGTAPHTHTITTSHIHTNMLCTS